jgi:type I restriction enzyme, S subunit
MGAEPRFADLGECLSLIIDHRGKTPKKLGSNWVAHGVPTISAKNVSGGKLVAEKAIRYVTHDVYRRWMNTGDVRRGDCLLVSEGATLGECMYWDEDYPVVLGQRLFCLRANPDVVYSRYLYFYMTTHGFQTEVLGRATGTSVSGLRQTEVLKLGIRLPSLEEQRAIGDTLYNLNKKIELNRRINETLERMVLAMFKSWFVDFDPIRAKVEGRTVLPQPLAGLFPGAFRELDSGTIPKGWEVRSLGDCLALLKDGSHNPPKRVKEGVRFLAGATDIKHFNVDFAKCTYISQVDYIAMHRKWSVQEGDVLLTIVGTVGNVALVSPDDPPFSLQRSIAVLRPGPMLSSSFLYCLLQSAEFQAEVKSRLNPTAQPGIYLGTLSAIPIFLPTQGVMRAFESIASTLFAKMQNNVRASRTLTALRDTLHTRVLSGEQRVKSLRTA